MRSPLLIRVGKITKAGNSRVRYLGGSGVANHEIQE